MVSPEINNPAIGTFYHVGFAAGDNGSGLAGGPDAAPVRFHPGASLPRVNVALTASQSSGATRGRSRPWYDYGVRRVFPGSGGLAARQVQEHGQCVERP